MRLAVLSGSPEEVRARDLLECWMYVCMYECWYACMLDCCEEVFECVEGAYEVGGVERLAGGGLGS
jgi:hypothetical protein